jgi:glycine/D-amino acid oxidase-like deaminating enzyme
MKIAVIGGGIFGSVTSYFLQNIGNEVTLFEKSNSLLSGASSKNQNRLHLGYHYPRDIETALQSVKGFNDFKEHFPSACEFNFPCYYGLSSSESKSTLETYMHFLDQSNLKYEEIRLSELDGFGFNSATVSNLWRCNEGVVDNEILRQLILQKLLKSGVQISLSNQITEISRNFDRWLVISTKQSYLFDVVINATYGLGEIKTPNIVRNTLNSLLQATLVIECELPMKKFGLTVIDGDFITILPRGFTDNFLIYSPGPSVMKQSLSIDAVTMAVNDQELISKHVDKLKERFKFYFPKIEWTGNAKNLITIRNLELETMGTDSRVSKIEVVAPSFFNIRSGKIDHSTLIAKKFCELLA